MFCEESVTQGYSLEYLFQSDVKIAVINRGTTTDRQKDTSQRTDDWHAQQKTTTSEKILLVWGVLKTN